MLRQRRPFMTLICRIFLALLLLSLRLVSARSDVMLEGAYLNMPSGGSVPWYWDRMAGTANQLRQAGFTTIWVPGVLKGNSGGYSNGYDPFDDYDIGSKNQKGTVSTHWGNRDQLERCVAMMRANGLNVYLDMVENHRNGDSGDFNFTYADAYGNPTGGRFQKGPLDFHPNVPQDPGVPDGTHEVSFGRDLAHINGAGGWVYNQLIYAGDWLTKALDVQGYRLDYVKGISTQWLQPFLNYGAMSGKFAVGEYWDGNIGSIRNWIGDMGNRASAFDFPLRFMLKDMCDNPGTFQMSRLDHAGLAGVDPFHAVTFVENHDLDGQNPIINRKAFAYAYILTSEGYPCVFYKDYFTYGLKPTIDNLIWIHEKLASGATQQRWLNGQIFTFERLGGPHLLVGMNNNLSNAQTINVNTGFGPNTQLHDYTGHRPDVWTDATGRTIITIPANGSGLGYVCYSRAGITGDFSIANLSVTQEYAGAQDLDIKPADNTERVQSAKVYVEAGQLVRGSLYFSATDWTADTYIELQLEDPTGAPVASAVYDLTTPQGTELSTTSATTGWYTYRIQSYNTPDTNLKPPYWLRVTYTAPQTFAEAVISDRVDIALAGYRLVSGTTYDYDFVVTNTSADTLAGPTQLAVTDLPPGNAIANRSGLTWDGLPYVGSARVPLAPGDSITVTIRISGVADPDALTYTIQPYARVW